MLNEIYSSKLTVSRNVWKKWDILCLERGTCFGSLSEEIADIETIFQCVSETATKTREWFESEELIYSLETLPHTN